MLTTLLAHQGEPLAPHDLWLAWNVDPWVVVPLAALVWAHMHSGGHRVRPSARRRARCFWTGVAGLVVALVSPLDALAGELASAHMVQHVLLVAVAPPLLAISSPWARLVAVLPTRIRRASARVRRRAAAADRRAGGLRWALVAWLVHTLALWCWHASAPYDLAVRHDAVHAAEHASFVLPALAFWGTITNVRRGAARSHGHGALLVFAMALQGALLAALITFATTAWYSSYEGTTQRWRLSHLEDQQLAGAIMWVPAGLIYVGTGVVFVTMWVRGARPDAEWTGGDAPPVTVTRSCHRHATAPSTASITRSDLEHTRKPATSSWP